MIEILFQLLAQNLRAAAAPPIDAAQGGGADAESEPSAFDALLASTLATLEGAAQPPSATAAPVPAAAPLDAAAAIDALAAEKKGSPATLATALPTLLADVTDAETAIAAPADGAEPTVASATPVETAPESASPLAAFLAPKLERRADARADDAARPQRDDAAGKRPGAEIESAGIETPEVESP